MFAKYTFYPYYEMINIQLKSSCYILYTNTNFILTFSVNPLGGEFAGVNILGHRQLH